MSRDWSLARVSGRRTSLPWRSRLASDRCRYGGGRWSSVLTERRRRPPLPWIGLTVLAVVLGLGSRRFGPMLPGFVAAYAGDTLWALVAFLGVGLLLPGAPTRRVAALAMSFVVSQLYHAR